VFAAPRICPAEAGGRRILAVNLNITSVRATLRSTYGAGKAAPELGPRPASLVGVAPGPAVTSMARSFTRRSSAPIISTKIPLNRCGLEEEVAEAIYFLSCDRARDIHGADPGGRRRIRCRGH